MHTSWSRVPWFVLSSLLLVSVSVASERPTVQSTTYTVYNAPADSVDGSEVLDLALTPDEQYAVVVGTNDDPADQKVRTVALSSANRFATQSFDLATQIPDRLVQPVVSAVAMHPSAGYAIVTVREQDAATIGAGNEQAGVAIFVTINTDGSLAFARNTALDLGISPESIAIAPNGQFAVISNSDPDDGSGNTILRSGTISVLDLRAGAAAATVSASVTPTLTATSTTRDADDLAPETVAISPNSARAFVTLQQNNAIAIIDVNLDQLPSTVAAVPLPRQNGTTGPRLFPDGLAISPDSQYLVTANEGENQERPNSISVFRIVSASQLDYLADSGSAIATAVGAAGLPVAATGSEPETVAITSLGDTFKAYVTLEQSDAVVAFDLTTTGGTSLALDQVIPLDRGQAVGPASRNPEGIAIATITSTRRWIITANTETHNVSLIDAMLQQPPSSSSKLWLPLITK